MLSSIKTWFTNMFRPKFECSFCAFDTRDPKELQEHYLAAHPVANEAYKHHIPAKTYTNQRAHAVTPNHSHVQRETRRFAEHEDEDEVLIPIPIPMGIGLDEPPVEQPAVFPGFGGGESGGGGASGSWDQPSDAPSTSAEIASSPDVFPVTSPSNGDYTDTSTSEPATDSGASQAPDPDFSSDSSSDSSSSDSSSSDSSDSGSSDSGSSDSGSSDS
jgi:hypothetical protein